MSNQRPQLVVASEEAVSLMMAAIEKVVGDYVEPLEKLGPPEKLIHKPYEQWSREELLTLGRLYGPEPNELSKLIFRKEYEKLIEMEKGV